MRNPRGILNVSGFVKAAQFWVKKTEIEYSGSKVIRQNINGRSQQLKRCVYWQWIERPHGNPSRKEMHISNHGTMKPGVSTALAHRCFLV